MNSLLQECTNVHSLQILVVEDDFMFNTFYRNFLSSKGAEVCSCLSLSEANDICENSEIPFDAVILDNQLLDGEGISLLPQLKQLQAQAAVIMVSGNDDPEFFLNAFAAGIHDYMVKPVNLELLFLKITKAVQQLRLTALSNRQHSELEMWVEQEQQQQTLAKHLFDSLFLEINQTHRAIYHWIQPCSVFSGDALLRFQAKDGCWYFILADAMGHGLAPAVSLMPLMHHFQLQAERAAPLANIVFELNGSLDRLLPDDRFVAAILLKINPWRQELEVWNGGMPALQCLASDGRLIATAASKNMALGVLGNAQTSVQPQLISLQDVDFLLMHSDGLTETPLLNGLPLESASISKWLALQTETPLQPLQELFANTTADDDVTLCLINCQQLFAFAPNSAEQVEVHSFQADFKFTGKSMVPMDLPGKVLDMLRSQNLALPFLQRVFTVLSELVANALEHGVLGLDSAIKDEPDGFIAFYEEKERRIAQLAEHQFIQLNLEWSGTTQQLFLTITDSGAGFLPKVNHTETEELTYGRGLQLIKQLSRQVEMIAPGNQYRVLMSPLDVC